MNLKDFSFCISPPEDWKTQTRQSLYSKSYSQEADVKRGAICLELSSYYRVLSMPYNTQNDIVNLILQHEILSYEKHI